MNQTVVFDNKICDYINFIMRVEHFKDCTLKEVLLLLLLILYIFHGAMSYLRIYEVTDKQYLWHDAMSTILE